MKWEEVVSRVGCCPEVRQDDAERAVWAYLRGLMADGGERAGRKQWVGRGWQLGHRGLRSEWEAQCLGGLGLNLGGRGAGSVRGSKEPS